VDHRCSGLDRIPNRHNCLLVITTLNTTTIFSYPVPLNNLALKAQLVTSFCFCFHLLCLLVSQASSLFSGLEGRFRIFPATCWGNILCSESNFNGYHNLFTARFTSTQHQATETTQQ
jgi:hypothetical protein